jgi:hypothetical protein
VSPSGSGGFVASSRRSVMIFAGAASRRKVELELPLPRRDQRPDDAAERDPLRECLVGLLDDAEVGEGEERVGVGREAPAG